MAGKDQVGCLCDSAVIEVGCLCESAVIEGWEQSDGDQMGPCLWDSAKIDTGGLSAVLRWDTIGHRQGDNNVHWIE